MNQLNYSSSPEHETYTSSHTIVDSHASGDSKPNQSIVIPNPTNNGLSRLHSNLLPSDGTAIAYNMTLNDMNKPVSGPANPFSSSKQGTINLYTR